MYVTLGDLYVYGISRAKQAEVAYKCIGSLFIFVVICNVF